MTLLRRFGLRRTAILRKRPPPVDKVALRRAVMERDGECVAHKLGHQHECRDVIGNPHPPTQTWRLSLERVKGELAMGVGAPYDLRHVVACCYGLNMRPPTKEMRASFRRYLREVNP